MKNRFHKKQSKAVYNAVKNDSAQQGSGPEQARGIKEDIRMIKRGIREFDNILPGQMAYLFGKSALEAWTPWIAVWMSAMILNELAGAGDRTRLCIFVLVSAGGTLLLSVLGHGLNARMAVGYGRLFSTHELVLTDKSFRLPFFELEREGTRRLREQVSGSMGLTGGGMASLYWDMEFLMTNLFRTAAALAAGVWFFRQAAAGVRDGLISGMEAAGMLGFLTVLTVGGAYFACRTASRRFAVSFDVFEHGAEYSRYGEFYDLTYLSDEDMAMDIRIFRQKELVLGESLSKCYRRLAEGKIREMAAVSRLDAARLLCSGICGGAVYGTVGFLAIRQVIGIGDVLMISAAVTMLITACSGLAEIVTDLRNNNVHLQNYFAYMDLEEETGEQKETMDGVCPAGRADGEAADSARGQIVFDRVSFHYPESETMVLRDITLKIAPGEKLAIAGENGSGKTTLIKLLCRLYEPTEGRILLNGRDIHTFSYGEYIRNIATVFQDFAVFAFSLAENLAASRRYDPEKVWEALARAGLQEKTEKLPKGIRQAVSHDYEEDGVNLSGGEAQKLAIARAVYKDAGIVILDEPTAALDPYAEKEIYEQFFRHLAEETMISVSHRLSSCRFCDGIAVLDQGRLVQLGTHEELLGQPEGKYAEMWAMQAQYYTSADA